MSDGFVRTGTILDEILEHKACEVELHRQRGSLNQVRDAAQIVAPPRDFRAGLVRENVALIAEVKHASPSKGILIKDFNPEALGAVYARQGAAAISVLTDERFFKGALENLTAVRNVVQVPVLRKDFVLDEFQIYEGRAAGADAILLIVAALADDQLRDLQALIIDLGMAALVEVHNEVEMERALKSSAALIGINNRDLKTFDVSLDVTARLAKLVPDNVILVAESGITSASDVRQMGMLGAHAVLVGEALVTAGDALDKQVREFSTQPRIPVNGR
jgi:indole-3-glycerol phosphate synthase